MLKPAVSTAAEDRLPKIGSKLLQLRQDSGFLRSTDNKLDQSTANIRSKVKEILANLKELKSTCWDDDDLTRPELSAKWVSLLTMEKASVSTIALDGIERNPLLLIFSFCCAYCKLTSSQCIS